MTTTSNNILIIDDNDDSNISIYSSNFSDDNISEVSDDIAENINIDQINIIIKKAYEISKEKTNNLLEKYIVSEPHVKKELRNKYKFLNRKDKKLYMYELLKLCGDQLSRDEKKYIIKNRREIIKGIYKHCQANKTAICNIEIMKSLISDKFVVAITKNTLFANEQWFIRLVYDLKKEYPNKKLNQLIAVLTSEKSDLNGQATHFKNISKLIHQLVKKDNSFRILFICSNSTRYKDIIEIVELNENLQDLQKKIFDIYIDEAHNPEEGIPAHRYYVENMLIYPSIGKIVPMTATMSDLYEFTEKSLKKSYKHPKNNYFWHKNILDKNAINYTIYCDIKSNSDNYSSLQDAGQITFEEIKQHNNYTEYNDVEFSEELYKYCYPTEENIDTIQKKRKIEHHNFMRHERDALNLCKNVLDNYYIIGDYEYGNDIISNEQIIKPGEFNIYIIRTPNRVIFNVAVIKYALEQEYQPICIGLYSRCDENGKITKIHIWYKEINSIITISYEQEIKKDDKKKETNEKIYEIIEYLKSKNVNVNVPFIIFGNYKNVGESITFVNYKYGTVRAVTILPELTTSKSRDNQAGSRFNTNTDKFKEKDNLFTMQPKFIIGYENHINAAVNIEKENDDRVDMLKQIGTNDDDNIITNNEIIHDNDSIDFNEEDDISFDGSNIAIPVKFEINDTDDDNYIEFRKILTENPKRDATMRTYLFNLMNNMYHNGVADIYDPTGKLVNFKERKINQEFTLENIRIFNSNLQHNSENYRIERFDAKHKSEQPYMNEKTKYKRYQCQIEVCLTKYTKEIISKDSFSVFINWQKTIWLGYKY
jgi:hypothetical protein